jgi:uncharacterized RDD family membrane protein YckC
MDDAGAKEDLVRIETPEHVVFEYELAGMGSRVLAASLDLLIVATLLAILLLVTLVVAGGLGELSGFWLAGALVAAFLVFWGYPILFELRGGGQTPGKRILGIRVIQEGGYALTPAAVVVRNLLRLVDFLPGAYFLGLLVMVLNRRYKRVGDFVAGTIVIRERRREARAPRLALSQLNPGANEEAALELRRSGVHRLEPDQVALVEDFLSRRHSLEPEARRRLADQLSRALMERLGLEGIPGERFLQSLVLAHRKNDERAEGGA